MSQFITVFLVMMFLFSIAGQARERHAPIISCSPAKLGPPRQRHLPADRHPRLATQPGPDRLHARCRRCRPRPGP